MMFIVACVASLALSLAATAAVAWLTDAPPMVCNVAGFAVLCGSLLAFGVV